MQPFFMGPGLNFKSFLPPRPRTSPKSVTRTWPRRQIRRWRRQNWDVVHGTKMINGLIQRFQTCGPRTQWWPKGFPQGTDHS